MDYPPVAKSVVTPDRVIKTTVSRPRPYYCRGDTVVLTNGNVFFDPVSGLPKVTVKFKTPVKDTNWVFSTLFFWNNTDADIDIVQLEATGRVMKSQAGFTVQLSAVPPTENYNMDWAIAERYNP